MTEKIAKSRHVCTIAQLSSGYIFATKACINNQKKNLLNSNVSPHVLTIWWTLAR